MLINDTDGIEVKSPLWKSSWPGVVDFIRITVARCIILIHGTDHVNDPDVFPQADVDFHFVVMTLSGNQLASNITKILFQRARSSSRFIGHQSVDAHALTLEEHRRVYEAIAAGDAEAAQAAMRAHIIDSWQRRRLPTQRKP